VSENVPSVRNIWSEPQAAWRRYVGSPARGRSPEFFQHPPGGTKSLQGIDARPAALEHNYKWRLSGLCRRGGMLFSGGDAGRPAALKEKWRGQISTPRCEISPMGSFGRLIHTGRNQRHLILPDIAVLSERPEAPSNCRPQTSEPLSRTGPSGSACNELANPRRQMSKRTFLDAPFRTGSRSLLSARTKRKSRPPPQIRSGASPAQNQNDSLLSLSNWTLASMSSPAWHAS
jgi:hypothetical protein